MCGSRKSLQVHHIIEYAKSKALRNEISNLITLCKKHHLEVTGKERHYVELLHNLIKKNA